jgi:DNA-binding transcriptional regulator YiaG
MVMVSENRKNFPVHFPIVLFPISLSMNDVYNIKELALALGVPWQTVMAWKRNNQIPTACMTDDGKFIKSVIDPFIEWYKTNPSTDTPMNQETIQNLLPLPPTDIFPHSETQQTDMAKRKKITYPAKVRQEAIRLLTEEKLSAKKVAEQLGCSYNTVLTWHKNAFGTPPTGEPSASAKVPVIPPSNSQPKKAVPEIDFDSFVRSFWNEGTRAVDVLLLPPEIGPKVINYVNEALKYAFEKLK